MSKPPIVVITGGAGHIGSAIGHALAAKGVGIVVVDKDEEAADLVAENINNMHGVPVLALQVDLLKPNSFGEIYKEVEEIFGRCDYVVNNAAFYDDCEGWGVPFEQEGYEAWQKVMQVNLLAPFFLVQALYPMLKTSGKGAVVNIGSIYGIAAPDWSLYEGTEMTNPAAYGASKGGLMQLTRWLSTALAPEVRVNSIVPGGIARGQREDFVQRYNAKTPLRRMGTEEDVAGAVAFLLSDEAAYITGQELAVDGGWTA